MAARGNRGVFLTLEGVDGCGKSSKARLLTADLAARGVEVVNLRDPGGTPVSEQLRSVLLDPANEGMTPACELLLYEAARAQLVEEAVLPALERGAVVVCDRFADSTLAYQAYGRGLPQALVREANRLGTRGLVPDRTILFDLPVGESYERATRHGVDRMELDGTGLQQRVRTGYLALAAAEPDRIRVVDASGEKAVTYGLMLDQLRDLIPQLEGVEAHA